MKAAQKLEVVDIKKKKDLTLGKLCAPKVVSKSPKLAEVQAAQANRTLDQRRQPHFLSSKHHNVTTNDL